MKDLAESEKVNFITIYLKAIDRLVKTCFDELRCDKPIPIVEQKLNKVKTLISMSLHIIRSAAVHQDLEFIDHYEGYIRDGLPLQSEID